MENLNFKMLISNFFFSCKSFCNIHAIGFNDKLESWVVSCFSSIKCNCNVTILVKRKPNCKPSFYLTVRKQLLDFPPLNAVMTTFWGGLLSTTGSVVSRRLWSLACKHRYATLHRSPSSTDFQPCLSWCWQFKSHFQIIESMSAFKNMVMVVVLQKERINVCYSH